MHKPMEPKPKILIVDDMQDNLQMMLNCLFNGGYLNVLCAKNGADALEIVMKERPDLIILDWDMPIMNGIEVLKKLRKNPETKLIPVIIATGAMLDSRDLEMALNEGAKDYIRKPYEGIELLARVQTALDFNAMLTTIHNQNQLIEKQNSILEENENRLTTLLNASDEACIFVEKDIIVEANQLFYNFTGYSREEVIHHSFYNFFPKDFHKTLTGIESVEREILTVSLLNNEGETLPVEMIVKHIEYRTKSMLAISFLKLNQFRQHCSKEHADHFLTGELKLKELNNCLNELKNENKTLLNQLQLKSMQSAQSNDFMVKLTKSLENIKQSIPAEKVSCKTQIENAVQQLNQHLNIGLWDEFKLRFADVHPEFYDKLLSDYPTLTEIDLRLCAFVKLKMSTKEIADVINQPVNSVKVARNRLRSKLRIEDASESLLTFLAMY
ncbi:MAG TPA: response regulator [Anaerovoracaceae bacterium]|nr:response regulator [Anaerovoracaceae bacterium]